MLELIINEAVTTTFRTGSVFSFEATCIYHPFATRVSSFPNMRCFISAYLEMMEEKKKQPNFLYHYPLPSLSLNYRPPMGLLSPVNYPICLPLPLIVPVLANEAFT